MVEAGRGKGTCGQARRARGRVRRSPGGRAPPALPPRCGTRRAKRARGGGRRAAPCERSAASAAAPAGR
eukprot:794233-Prymnesium_polylepis.1